MRLGYPAPDQLYLDAQNDREQAKADKAKVEHDLITVPQKLALQRRSNELRIEEEIAVARKRRALCQIVSPVSGRVASVEVGPGSFMEIGVTLMVVET